MHRSLREEELERIAIPGNRRWCYGDILVEPTMIFAKSVDSLHDLISNQDAGVGTHAGGQALQNVDAAVIFPIVPIGGR